MRRVYAGGGGAWGGYTKLANLHAFVFCAIVVARGGRLKFNFEFFCECVGEANAKWQSCRELGIFGCWLGVKE